MSESFAPSAIHFDTVFFCSSFNVISICPDLFLPAQDRIFNALVRKRQSRTISGEQIPASLAPCGVFGRSNGRRLPVNGYFTPLTRPRLTFPPCPGCCLPPVPRALSPRRRTPPDCCPPPP